MAQYEELKDTKIYKTPQGEKLIIPVEYDPEDTDFEGCPAACLEYNGDTWAVFVGVVRRYDGYDITDLRTTKSDVKDAVKAAEDFLSG